MPSISKSGKIVTTDHWNDLYIKLGLIIIHKQMYFKLNFGEHNALTAKLEIETEKNIYGAQYIFWVIERRKMIG